MKRRSNWLTHFFNLFTVVLGVYLAFYINEWSKDNQDQKEAQALMLSMIDDLEKDIKGYEGYHIPVNKAQRTSIDTAVEALLASDMETFSESLSQVLAVENYAPTKTTYSSMKAAGKLGLFDDLSLQSAISNYYEGLVVESEFKGTYQADYFTGKVLDWVAENIDLLTMEFIHENDLTVFQNRLLIYQSLIDQKVSSYEEILENSKALKAKIEEHLN